MTRIFRSEDGAELQEEDVWGVVAEYRNHPTHPAFEAAERLVAALAPRTCGAVLAVRQLVEFPCVLPPGHHPIHGEREVWCGKKAADPIHSPGHMTAPECWREP